MWNVALLTTAVGCLAYAQAGDTKPVFEVATIKPSAPPGTGGMFRVGCSGGPGTPDPGRWACQNLSLSNMITNAYNLKRYEFSAPAWLEEERFDITAKIAEGTTRQQLR